MCGIAGWINPQAHADDVTTRLRLMLDAMARRGPDGHGVHVADGVALGHRRLAIFDLSPAGAQPMATSDGRVMVTFNGAIYNWLPLRATLESAGHQFRTQTDTEVLLVGYREWGIDGLLERIEGMFAFGLWDADQRTMHLVRDRLGVKPLIYGHPTADSLCFASTPGALHAAGFGGDINPHALGASLRLGYVPDEMCIWEGLEKLPPAHLLTWRAGGGASIRQYWEHPTAAASGSISFADAVEATEVALLEAVRLRLAADVPVGCLLSGGIDSSLVAWAASQLHAGVRTFTVATPGDPADESPVARATAKRLGLPHDVLPLDGGLGSIDELVAAYTEPFGVSSALGLLKVSEAIRPHATVVLTGDGGDEGFLGYPEHLVFQTAERLAGATPAAIAGVVANVTPRVLHAGAGPLRRPLRLVDYATRGMAAVDDAQRSQWQGPWQQCAGPRLAETLPAAVPDQRSGGGRRLLGAYVAHQRRTAFVGEYLPKVDGGTMHHALEARSPFLDHNLWTLAGRLPHEVRLHGRQLKAVLRELARRHLGPELARGRKRGFTIPVERWIASGASPMVDRLRDDSPLVRGGWCTRSGVEQQVAAARRDGVASTFAWHLLATDAWLRHHHESGASDA